MPDLGKYAVTVLSGYGASLFILGALVLWSLRRNRVARDRLNALENMKKTGRNS